MKNIRQLCFYIVCLLLAQVAVAQNSVLKIRELPGTQRDTLDVATGGLPIVDINSQLLIEPNVEAIQRIGRAQFPQFFQKDMLENKAGRINDALANQDRIIQLTKQMMTGLNVQKDLLKEVEQYLVKVSEDTLLADDFNNYTEEYFQQYAGVPVKQRPDRFLYSIGRFNEQLEQIAIDLKGLKPGSQIQFSIAAWRRDPSGGARIHVENFDRLENGEFFSVPRWVTTLSDNDREQLDNYRDLAQGLNESATQVLEAYKAKVLESFPSIVCVQQIRPELDSAIQSVTVDLKVVLEQFKNGATAQIIPVVTALRSELSNWPATQQPEWGDRLLNTLFKLKAASDSLQVAVGDSILLANQHLLRVNSCLQQTVNDVQRVQDLVKKFPYSYLHKVRLNSQELAEEITAFNLSEIPPAGVIDLQYTGQRAVGDEVLIKAVFRLPNDSSSEQSTGHAIEAQRIKMVLIGAHTTTKVGLIMANPYTLDPPADAPKFRFAPSAALLLKFGSRKSHFYNNFIDAGIGLNSAAPDFDLDGNPEFSAGITGTILRDILSIGWNWNFTLDRPNYFIGIHLPFNLPGLPVNTIQNNPLP